MNKMSKRVLAMAMTAVMIIGSSVAVMASSSEASVNVDTKKAAENNEWKMASDPSEYKLFCYWPAPDTFFDSYVLEGLKAGESIYITRGNSVRLDPYVNHTFGAKMGDGPLIAGEVSKVNDDNTDNYFAEPTARFADIEEDEPVLYPLCNEYDKWFPKND